MRQFFFLFISLIFAQTIHAQTISGRIVDKETNEGLPFANVILLESKKQVAGTTTDLDGNYVFENLKKGNYIVEAIYVGYPNQRITDIKINDKEMEVDVEMKIEYGTCYHPIIYTPAYIIPLIDLETPYTGQKLRSWDIKRRF